MYSQKEKKTVFELIEVFLINHTSSYNVFTVYKKKGSKYAIFHFVSVVNHFTMHMITPMHATK